MHRSELAHVLARRNSRENGVGAVVENLRDEASRAITHQEMSPARVHTRRYVNVDADVRRGGLPAVCRRIGIVQIPVDVITDIVDVPCIDVWMIVDKRTMTSVTGPQRRVRIINPSKNISIG